MNLLEFLKWNKYRRVAMPTIQTVTKQLLKAGEIFEQLHTWRERHKEICQAHGRGGGGRERGKVTQTHHGGGLQGSCHQEWDRCEGVLLADQHISPRN